jgi:hypothetical protein
MGVNHKTHDMHDKNKFDPGMTMEFDCRAGEFLPELMGSECFGFRMIRVFRG